MDIYSTLVNLSHTSLIILVLSGWAILPKWTLIYQLFIVPLIILDWNDFDGQCILTRLEHYLRTGTWQQAPANEEDAPEFFRPLLEWITGRDFTRTQASRINYSLFTIAWIMTMIMYIRHNCKSTQP